MHSLASLLVTAALVCSLASASNPVSIPIIHGQLNVHTKRLAQLPRFEGDSAKIICIVPHQNHLYVCTLNAIYKVNFRGSVSLYLDIQKAIASQTPRSLNYDNRAHGGVRSIAFHPDFPRNGLLYVSAMESRPSNPKQFTYISDTHKPIAADSVLLEFKHNFGRGVPDHSSYRNVFRVGMRVFDHPIKQIAFREGLLYIAHGDGSFQSATAGGGQRNDALGKILRINPLRSGNSPYTVPQSNPFMGASSMKDEVYALGFRNPHQLCFGNDGTLYVADAGRDNIEEIDLVVPGGNYGWAEREGTFVHLSKGGLVSGVQSLPSDDAKHGYIYPAAQVGHEGRHGAGFVGQAVAGGCPIENNSPMSGNYYYCDFPKSGKLYYSTISELKSARTTGSPSQLTQARTRQATIFFDHDNNPGTPPKKFDSLGDLVRYDTSEDIGDRADIRLGRGPAGQLYWSSKANGRVYIFTSSMPGGPGGPV
ncbi:HHIP-like protein 1 [Gracilariopsis chorda]|uniref:HHIP-like protein 1 n=1 Tax=Gracilariopsis chorda TaxID=448386 RepID=A0A2V3IGB7_9FLOR|nr:HHIP-like protein 1 [Gracilariopsis chorda]|eukprot:PXF41078.1 HHIP-like protein 1 [Gracilariopsis chorda]